MIRSNCFMMASRWSKMRINCAGRTIICQEIERKGPGDGSVVRGKSVAFLAVLLALKLSRKFQTGNRQSQLGWVQWGKTKRSKRDQREREGERWKVEFREERRGFIVDPASNAYSHVAEMPIVCLTPPMDILRRIKLKPVFIIVALRILLSSASLITLSSFSCPEQLAEIFLVAIEGIRNREWYASK